MELTQFLARMTTGQTPFAEFAKAFTEATGLTDESQLATELTARGLLADGAVACGIPVTNIRRDLNRFIVRRTATGTMAFADFFRAFCAASGTPGTPGTPGTHENESTVESLLAGRVSDGVVSRRLL